MIGAFIVPDARAQNTYNWNACSHNGSWDWGGAVCNLHWIRDNGDWLARPDSAGAGYVRFNNNNQTTMDLNGGTFSIYRLYFDSGATTARTLGGGTGINFTDSSGNDPKLENNSSATHVISTSGTITGDAGDPLEINPVDGDITIHSSVNNNGQWINVYGTNGKGLRLYGVVSGSGGLAIKQHSIVIQSNNNTYSGTTWVEKGRLRIEGHTNSTGNGKISVGTNATVEINSNVRFRPVQMDLYGMGTNDAKGTIDSLTGGEIAGNITLFQDAKIRNDGATSLNLRGTIDAGSSTLYITNSTILDQTAGDFSGSKTTGDGALRKTGTERFLLRPGSGLSGSIFVDQGELRQGTGTMPGGGEISLAGGVTWSADTSSRTVTKPVNVNGNVTLGRNANAILILSNTVNLANAVRTISVIRTNEISGVVTNGGLTVADGTQGGTLTLSGNNLYSGDTRISAGTLRLGSSLALQNSTLDMNSGDSGNVDFTTPTSFTFGGLTGSRNLLLGTNKAFSIGNNNSSTTYSGQLSGSGSAVNKIGTGTFTLTGASSYTGPTISSNGVLILNGTNTSTAVTVGNAFLYGAGSVGSLTISGQFSAGSASNTVGRIAAQGLTLPSNGRMQVNVSAMTGTAGTDWDVISVGGAGTYTVDAVDGSDFVIALKGNPTFDNGLGYTNIIVDAVTASGFVSNKFTIDTSEFIPGLAGGTFSVGAAGGDLLLIFVPLIIPPVYEWDAGGGSGDRNWSTAANWTQNTEPQWTNAAYINGSFTGVVSAANERAAFLYIGSTNQPSNGANSTGQLEQTGGDLVISTNLFLGKHAGGNGTYIMTGGTLTVSNRLYVGDQGLGTMVITNSSTVTIGGETIIGNTPLSTVVSGSRLSMGGGTLTLNGAVRIGGDNLGGTSGDGELVQYGGTITAANVLKLGDDGNSTGAVRMAGGVLSVSSDLTVGENSGAIGIMNISGVSTTSVAGVSYIGRFSGSRGILNVSNGLFAANGTLEVSDSTTAATGIVNVTGGRITSTDIIIGRQGFGTVSISGGAITAQTLAVSYAPNGIGSITVSGGRLVLTGNDENISLRRRGALMTVSGGTVEANGIAVGSIASHNSQNEASRLNLSGGTIFGGFANAASFSNDFYIGSGSARTGVVNITGGILDLSRANNDLVIGRGDGALGIFTMGGGTATVAGAVNVGAFADDTQVTGNGEIYLTNGLFNVGGAFNFPLTVGSTATMSQVGGIMKIDGNAAIGSAGSGGVGRYVMSGGTLTNKGTFTIGHASSGSGFFEVVDGGPTIRLGNLTVAAQGELRSTFSGTSLSPILVAGTITAGGTLSITNVGAYTDGYYLIATSVSQTAVSGTFAATNWLGGVTGVVSYANNRIMVLFGRLPSLDVTPLTLNYSVVLGSSPDAQTFTVSNRVTSTLALNYTNYQTYGTGASGWFAANLTNNTLAAGSSRIHTGHVASASITAVGTYVATNRVDGNQTNAAQLIVVTLTVTNIPDPSAASATASGAEFIRLEWTRNVNHDVMIVHKAGSASTAPNNGTTYNLGDSVGGGTVIYKGSGAALDHVVSSGVTHHYAFYSINNNNYSPGLTASDTTSTYNFPIVETFSYTNQLGAIGRNGGTGFTGAWADSPDNAGIFTVSSQQQFTTISGYSVPAGNIITGNNAGIYREFTAFTTGKIYAIFMMRTDNGGGSQYSGLSFFDNGTEERFFGEGFSQVNSLTVGGASGHQLANNTDYTIVAMYDFQNDVARALLYTNGTQSVPPVEPGTWHVSESDASVSSINRIRIQSNVGTRWDEIRIGYSWADLVGSFPTYEWDAGGGSGDRDWSTAANWTADTEPIAVSNAFINGGYTGVVSVAGEVAANLYIGNSGTGRLEQTGGSLSVTNFYLGLDVNDSASYVMSGGALTVAVDMAVGYGGMATAQIHGASSKIVIGGNLEMGFSNANNRAQFIQGGGTVSVNRIYLGKLSATEGSYSITNGVLNVGDDIYLADGSANSTGRMVIAGNGVVNVADEFYAGRNGQGILAVRDSGVLNLTSGSGHLEISDLSGNNNNNLVQVGGGTISVGGDIKVADAANSFGSLVVSNGTLGAGGDLYIGNSSTATGIMVVAGGFVDPDDFYVGYLNNGSLDVTGGSITADQFEIGFSAGSLGVMTMSGGEVHVDGTVFNIGAAGLGSLTLSGGSIFAGDGSGNTDVSLGSSAGGKGTFTHLGGTLKITSTTDSDLEIGGTSSTGLYILAGSGNLDASVGDDILIHTNGELRLIGSGWSSSVDDDFTMDPGATLGVILSNGISRIVVDTDITVAGTLNVSNYGSVVDGSYVVITSITRSVTGTFAATNWLGGYTGTVSYANGKVELTFITPAEIAVLGTNYAEIASGSFVPSTANGTDFGSVSVAAGTVSRTFFITNLSGGASVFISGVTTSGTGAADFTVLNWPASVSALSASNLTIQFDPSVSGLRTAVVTIANNDSNEGTYTFTIQGVGTVPGISNNPTTLAVSSTLGTTPSAVSFGVTNIGTGTLSYDISTNAGWLTVSPVSGSIASLAGQQHTVTFATLGGFAAGLSNATITVSDVTASNNPQTVVVNWTINAIANPSAQTAAADGNELIRLAWTKDASYDVMIIHDTAAISTEPTQGASYSVGGTIGSGRVIYKGNGAALEHIVAAGSANHYKFYSINNDFYSSGVSANDTTGSYAAGEIVDQYAYTNAVSLNSRGTGQGWTNNWTVSAPHVSADVVVDSVNFATFQSYWPSEKANRVVLKTTNSSDYFATRNFAGITTGKVYVAVLSRRQFNEGAADAKYAGINLLQGNADMAYFGERGAVNNDDVFGVTSGNSSNRIGADDSFPAATDYLIIGRYDFDTDIMAATYYTSGQAIPGSEPAFIITVTNSAVSRIDGVRLSAGAQSGWPGEVHFDELRVAQSWSDLLRLTAPNASAYVINGGANVGDGQVASGTFSVQYDFYDIAGMTNSAAPLPSFDLWNSTGTRIIASNSFSTLTRSDNGRALRASNTTHSTVSASSVTLGTYTSRWTAANSNGVIIFASDVLSNGTKTVFTVVDDDVTAPILNTIHSTNSGSLRNLHVSLVASSITGSGSSTNITYTLTDGQLANIASSGPLIFWFGANDQTNSGLARSTANPDTNTSFSIGSAIVSNVANYDASRSSDAASSATFRGTNVWTWTTAFTAAEIDNLVTNTALGYGTNAVKATIRDGDLDRGATDQLSLVDQQVGILIVNDDDTAVPVHSGFRGLGRTLAGATYTNSELLGGLIITGLVNDVGSGVYGGTSNQYVLTRDGSSVDSGSMTAGFSNGGNGSLSNTISSVIMAVSGTYTLSVYSVDYDIDRPNDSLSVTSFFTFVVVEAPAAPGLLVTPLTFTYDVMVGGPSTNRTFTVQNIGTGILSYTNYQTYSSGASGWFSALPVSSNLLATVTQTHTGVVSVSTLSAGTYIATNRVDGNQTNAAQLLIVTLNVTNIPQPTSVSAIPYGAEYVSLNAADARNRTILVVHRETNAPATPANGTAYSVGADVGGNSRVIFKFVGSSTVSNMEHIVTPGSTNHYAFYTVNNDHYSLVVSAGATTAVYSAREIVDVFAYTNLVSLGSSTAGGQGWSGGWVTNAGVWAMRTNGSLPFGFIDKPNYPSNAANRLKLTNPGNGNDGTARRVLTTPITNGTIYAAAFVAYQFNGANKFAGLNFMSNTTSKAFFGEVGHADKTLGLAGYGGTNVSASYNFNDFNADTNNYYLVIGAYEFATRTLKVVAYYRTTTVPLTEPATWDAYATVPSGLINMIDGIRLHAGSTDAGATIGDAFYDEIRVGTRWSDLVIEKPTYEWDADGGSDRDWSTALNWTANTEPTILSNAYINGGFTSVVSQAGERAFDLYIGSTNKPSHGANSTGRVEQIGGDLLVSNAIYIGKYAGGVGSYFITNGTLTTTNFIYIGDQGLGTLVITNSGSVTGREVVIGNAGTGAETPGSTLTVGGGSFAAQTFLYIGGYGVSTDAGADGQYEQFGGIANVGTTLRVGNNDSSTGRLFMAGGVLNVGLHLQIGNYLSSRGTVNVSGLSSFTVGGDVTLGRNQQSVGSLSVSGGTFTVAGDINASEVNTSTGTINVAGGSLVVSNVIYVGLSGIGSANISGGTVTARMVAVSYTNVTSHGTVNVSGGRLVATNFGEGITLNRRSAAMNVSGGSVEANGIFVGTDFRGSPTAGPATLNLTGGTIYGGLNNDTALSNDFYIGGAPYVTGVVNITSGTLDLSRSNNDMILGRGTNAMGILTMGGGTILVGDAVRVGALGVGDPEETGSGQIFITNGLFDIGGNFQLPITEGGTAIVSQVGGIVDVGGSVRVGVSGGGGDGTYVISGGILTNAGSLDIGHATGGSGYFEVVGGTPTIHVGSVTMAAQGKLRSVIAGSNIAPIYVDGAISVAGTLSITNTGVTPDGTYLIATSINGTAVSGAFATTNWLSGVTGTVSYADNCVRIIIITPPEIAILGTNYAVITSGSSVPATANGTDFGSLSINGGAISRTFFITNSGGGATLTISGVTTSGTGAADFTVLDWPASVSKLSASNLTISFDPSVVGLRTAVVTVANNDYDEGSYTFTIQGTGTAPGLDVKPLVLTYHVILGGTPSNRTFAVTNTGTGFLNYTNYQTYGTNGTGWFVANPTNNALASLASRVHTGIVDLTSITTARTYIATNRVAGDQTNAAQNVVITLIVTNIPNPSAQSATTDGPEMVRLAWTKRTDHDVMIVHQAGSAPGLPLQNTLYSLGDAIPGGGSVIYKGAGAALEHIVSQGTAHHYKFFSMQGTSYYSTGALANATTPSYTSGELVEDFSYTNAVILGGRGGGQGWTNSWTVSAPNANVDTLIDDVNFTSFQLYWPAEFANRFVLKTTNSSTYSSTRNFAGITTGKVYVAALYRREFSEGLDGKFSGIRMLSGTAEQSFFGERGGTANEDIFGVSVLTTGGVYGAVDSFPAATDYLIIGRYDFSSGIMAGIYYTSAQSVPTVEPTFFISATNAGVTRIDGVSLVSGAASGWNGQVFFDEVRVAQSWADLLKLAGAPYVTNYVVGTTNQVNDAQVNAGTFPVIMRFVSGVGIETTNTISPFFIPNFDLFNTVGQQVVTNQVFSSFSYNAAGTSVLASNNSHTTVNADQITLGTYTSRWSAAASNGLTVIDSTILSNGTAMSFTVIDDDSVAPVTANITSPNSGASRSMHVSTNNASVSGNGAGNGITYTLVDAALTNITGGSPLVFYFGGGDVYSGLARGNDTALTNSSLTIGAPGGVVSNVFNWDSTRSSTQIETTNANATSAWSWVGAFLPAEIDFLVTNTVSGVMGSNRVSITWRDADSDRTNDQSSLVDEPHGWLVVNDDDITAPTVQNLNIRSFPVSTGELTVTIAELQSGTGWGITGRVSDAGSGINVYGTNTAQQNISPYFELWDYNGVMQLRKAFNTIPFTNGGATTLSSIGSFTNDPIFSASAGIWTARVVVADADNDRSNDRIIITNEFAFTVIVGPSQTSMQVSPTILNVTSTYGSVAGDINWPRFTVTNNGIGNLIYTPVISYSGGSGWLTVSPSVSNSVGTGLSRIHTAAVDTVSLNPGTYQATVSLVGNQTNGTKTVTVNLTVYGYYVGEIVDQFTNAVAGSLNGKNGGSGWTNVWTASSAYTFNSGNLSVPANYPANLGNKVCGSSATEIIADRSFPSFSTGKIFVATAINKDANNNSGYIGVSLLDGSTSVGYFGKIYNSEWLGLDGTNSSIIGSFGIYQSTYLIIGYYDFDTDIFRARAYNPGDTLPLTQPSSWNVSNNYTITRVDAIRLGAKEVGNACFDEVRVANSWEALLNQFNAEPTLHATGMSFTNVTTNSMTVSWNNGNGGARIVVARLGQAVSFSPTDGVNYTANANFSLGTDLGSGNKIVYNGSGNNIDVSGLLSETNYFYTVFEYNGSGATTDYLTSGTPLTGSRWTLKIESAGPVTNFMAFPASATQITNTWSAVTNTPVPDGYLILRRNGNVVSNVPQDGVAYAHGSLFGDSRVSIVTNGSYEVYLHSNMTSCSMYHFVIYPFSWNGVSGETYNYYTNNPATTNSTTQCEAPNTQASNIVFSLIGTNTITLSWDNGTGTRRTVVARGTNAVNQYPVDGTSYTASSTFGSGSHLGNGNFVVYRDTGSTVTVVGLAPGVTYHFFVFDFEGSGSGSSYNTNTANLNPRSTATAAFGLVEDKFGGYSGNLFGENGGTGWTNSWGTLSGAVDISAGSFGAFGAYPADSGTDKVYMNSVTKRSAWRSFPAMTSGKFVIAMKLNVGATVQNAYFGINLLNGAASGSSGANNVTGFVGKAFGVANNRLTLAHNGQQRTNKLDGSNSGYTLNSGSGNDYLMVAEYDFDARTFKARAYTSDNVAHADPDQELAWVVEMTNVTINAINGVEIIGEGLGDTYYDHIRIGPSWEEVMWNLRDNWHIDNGPTPTLAFIGTNYNAAFYSQLITNLSDAELRSAGNIDFAVRWDSSTGVFTTNSVASMAITNIGSNVGRVNPNWDPLAVGVASNQFNLDKFFTNYFGYSGANVVTSYHKAAFNITNIDFEVQYFVTVSAENYPGGTTVTAPNGADPIPVTRAITINEPMRFYVYDDDTNNPTIGTNSLIVMTNTSIAGFQDVGDQRRYFVTDGSLASNGMAVSLNVYDSYSGIQRSTVTDASTNMSLTVAGFVTSNTIMYSSTRSSADTKLASASNLWNFVSSNFTYTSISAMWGGDGSGAQGQDMIVSATVPDADEDRLVDQSILSNQQFGIIRISDDDTAAPITTNITYGAGTVNNRPFYIATNGFSPGSDNLIRGTYPRRSGVGPETIFALTDAELANPNTANLEFVFGVRDNETGISRGTSGTTNDVMSFSIGSNIVSGVFTQFNAGLSSGSSGAGVLQTNIYTFANGFFTENIINALMDRTAASSSATVRVTVPDADNDRVSDRSTLFSQNVGQLEVYDDDVSGPTLSGVEVPESVGGDTIIATSFETSQGWPSSGFSSAIATNVTDGFGTWYTEGVTYTSLDPKNTGSRRLGFLTNDFPTPWLQLPPVTNPGTLFLYAARVGGGSGIPSLQAERFDGFSWVAYTNLGVNNTVYQQYSWDIDEPGSNILLRVRRVDGTGVQRTQIYVDDISLTARSSWISTNQVRINWPTAVDDFSGLDEYRFVPPAEGSVAPSATNSGTQISGATTTTVQSILGYQGVITGYIFAIDNDSDRSNDRSMGNVAPIIVRVDTNPPLRVGSADTIVDATIDDTDEVKVTWTNVTAESLAAGWRQSDSSALSPWDTYVVRYHELDISTPVTTEITRASSGWSAMGSHTFTNLIISNLNFDASYRITIQGRDDAGNIGPMVTVTGITTIFSVTQGFNRVDRDLEVRWIWNEERTYDIVYADNATMTDSLTSQWDWVTTITNAGWMTDTGAVDRTRPLVLDETLRFYRVSRQNAWQTNNTTRRGSVEVYVTKPLNLYTGENWHSLFFLPDTATVSYVFNTNILPAADNFGQSTKISWFGPSYGGTSNQSGVATAVVWLADSGNWIWYTGGVGIANEKLVPLDQGFLLEIPGNVSTNQSVARQMMIIGRVPTQQVEIAIGGGSVLSNNIFVLSHNMPVRTYLTNMGFRGSGFYGNNNGSLADEIRILAPGGSGSLENPKARIRLRTDGVTWQYYSAPAAGEASDPRFYIIDPDDAVVVIRRNAAPMVWTNKVWYSPPTKNFAP